MTASVRILSTCSVDSSPALLLVNTDGSRILVNCGEGCQRCFLEHSQKLSTVKAVCLTHLSHSSIGGLPGMILTVSDVLAGQQQSSGTRNKKNGIEIIGPSGTQTFVDSLSAFMKRDQFSVHVHEGENTVRPTKDPSSPVGFTIRSLAFGYSNSSNNDDGTQTHLGIKRQYLLVNQPQTLSYLFTSPPIPGKFRPDLAVKLGVPKGPLYGKLKSGLSVEFQNSIGDTVVVHPGQVLDPGSPGVAVLVLYYETPEQANVIINSRELSFQCSLFDQVQLELIVHVTPDPGKIEEFVSFFQQRQSQLPQQASVEVEHLFLSTDSTKFEYDRDGTPFSSAAMGAMSRHLVCRSVFQVPRRLTNHITTIIDDERGGKASFYKVGRTMMEYLLIPRQKRGFSVADSLESRTYEEEEAQKLVNFSGAGAAAERAIGGQELFSSGKGELFFTGTGSAIPCKHRNVTGMSLKALNGYSMLLDVGEGTIGQLLRVNRGREDIVDASLATIRAVWVSHPHADHHLGLLRLLHERQSSEPLLLIAPTPIIDFLDQYASFIEPEIQSRFVAVNCLDLVVRSDGAFTASAIHQSTKQKLMEIFGWTDIRSVPVTHCAHAFALILDGTPFGRLVYSGDCRPSKHLATIASPADLLIHEATFEDGLEDEARLKQHSTIGEALAVASNMGPAKCTILTHFSQRYPRIAPVPTSGVDTTLIFAFDYMLLTPTSLVAASLLTEALRLLYPGEESADESESGSLSKVDRSQVKAST